MLHFTKAAGFYESLQTEHHLREPVHTLGRTCNTSQQRWEGTKAASERVTETERKDVDTGHLQSLWVTCLVCRFLHKHLWCDIALIKQMFLFAKKHGLYVRFPKKLHDVFRNNGTRKNNFSHKERSPIAFRNPKRCLARKQQALGATPTSSTILSWWLAWGTGWHTWVWGLTLQIWLCLTN